MAKKENKNDVKNNLIIKPRSTEKGAILADSNVYVFEIKKDSNKSEIKKEVEKNYGVKPVKVNIAKNPKKNIISRGKRGVKAGVKKAYVYLKDGDKIELS